MSSRRRATTPSGRWRPAAGVEIPVPDTILDGQRNTAPAALSFEVNRRLADQVVLVTDDEVMAAMAFVFNELKVVVEPSGAAGVAALLAQRVDVAGQRVGVVLSGGNVDVRDFCSLVTRIGTDQRSART